MTLPPTVTSCPEKQLLLCCARVRIQPEIADSIRRLVSGRVDWDYVFAEAAQNSLIPLLHRNLSAAAAEDVPTAQMDALTIAARANTARSLLLTAETIKMTSALLSAGVRVIPYKGAVLAAQAYGDVALRQFEDVDIVLQHAELPKAHEVMLAFGYRPKYAWTLSADVASSLVPGDYNYRDDQRETMVELHTQRSMRHFPVAPDLDVFIPRLVPVLLSGHEIKTFAAEDALPILCIHGSKHFWERISWIADISEMIQSRPELDWDEVFRRADSFLGGRMLRVGLALAANLLGTPLPADVVSRVQQDGAATEIAAQIGRRLLRRAPTSLGAAARFRLRRQMVRSAFAGWRYAMRLATAPSEEDWEMVRLPAALAPLYAALRPIRLLRKYGGGR
jgi:putative nucleotidyltransferase-like protein